MIINRHVTFKDAATDAAPEVQVMKTMDRKPVRHRVVPLEVGVPHKLVALRLSHGFVAPRHLTRVYLAVYT